MSKKKKIVAIVLAAAVIASAAGVGIGIGIRNASDSVDFGEIVIDGIPERKEGTTRVMSFNVRCKSDPEGSINNRSKLVTAILDQYAPDSFGVQEATAKWMRILKRELGDRYACVGQPRDRLGPFSEYSAVFYLKDKYTVLDSGTFWLSETPEVKYSVSYDSACRRIASWAMLEDKETGLRYTHINTHLDHVLESTRVGQAGVLLDYLKEFQEKGTVVITGDFNAYESESVYTEMVKISDDVSKTAKTADSGITFHNYGKKEDKGQGAIDYIFVTKDTEAENYKIIDNTVKGMYPSDHYPISADIYLK